jgi:hypothetical protein
MMVQLWKLRQRLLPFWTMKGCSLPFWSYFVRLIFRNRSEAHHHPSCYQLGRPLSQLQNHVFAELIQKLRAWWHVDASIAFD